MNYIKYIMLILSINCSLQPSKLKIEKKAICLESSSNYLVADGKDKVDFTLLNNEGDKLENFNLFYSFNNLPYVMFDKRSLSINKKGDFKIYAQSYDKTKSNEIIVHARKDLDTCINISKFGSIDDLYIKDGKNKIRIGCGNLKYIYEGKVLENFLSFSDLNEAYIEARFNNSKIGTIHLKLFNVKLDVNRSKIRVGDNLDVIKPIKIINGIEENLDIKDLIVRKIDFSLRQDIKIENLEVGSYLISRKVEIDQKKVLTNTKTIKVKYENSFKNAEIILLPNYLLKLDDLNFGISNNPFIRKDNLYINDLMIIYKSNKEIFATIVGNLTSVVIDVKDNKKIIDKIKIKGNNKIVELSNNMKDWPGLINLGNTCFFNAAIKAISSTIILDASLESNYKKDIKIRALIRTLVNGIRLGKKSPFASYDKLSYVIQKKIISRVLKAISNNSSYERMDDGNQHDCEEALNCIIQLTNIEEFNRNIKTTSDTYSEIEESYNKNNSLIKSMFITDKLLKSNKLKISEEFLFEPISFEFFKFLDRDNTSIIPIQKLVNDNLNSTSIVKNFNIESSFIDIIINRKLLKISDYFLFNIVRKIPDPKNVKKQIKDNRKVSGIIEVLEMPYFNYLDQVYSIVKFEPIACTVHLGGSNGGHYITYIKGINSKKWYSNDDNRVQEKTLTDDIETICTIIYKKQPSPLI